MADKSLIGRIAAHTYWSGVTDRTKATAPARKAAEERFVTKAREMHPDATEEQITAVAASLRSAHYLAMARRSAQVRRRPKATAAEHRAKAEALRSDLDAG